VLLLLLGVVVFWLARARAWVGLAGISALVADFAVLVVGTGALSKGADVDRGVALATLVALFVLYVGSLLTLSLRQRQSPAAFDLVQASLVTLVGLGGAAWVASEIGPAVTTTLGLAAIGAGIGGYALILRHPLLAADRGSALVLFACLSWILTAAGLGITMTFPAVGWSLAAVVAAMLARRPASPTLEIHAALFLLVAAIESGLLGQAFAALVAPYDAPLTPFTALHGVVVLATAITVLLPVGGADASPFDWRRWLKTALTVLFLLGAAGLALSVLEPLARSGDAVDPARLAALRTGTVAALTVLTAIASRFERLHFATVLVYPLLAAGGLKLLVEDFFVESPRHLVVALPLYAAALIIAPRLRRTSTSPEAAP